MANQSNGDAHQLDHLAHHSERAPKDRTRAEPDSPSVLRMICTVWVASVVGMLALFAPMLIGGAIHDGSALELFGGAIFLAWFGTPYAVTAGTLFGFPLLFLAARLRWTSRRASLLLGGATGAMMGGTFYGSELLDHLHSSDPLVGPGGPKGLYAFKAWMVGSRDLAGDIQSIVQFTVAGAIAGYVARKILIRKRKA